jgi:YesN/AraC family two-component response regulator
MCIRDRSNTTDDDDLERIMEYLKTDKQYLNPNLSIHEISKSLDIPQARVTYCFNKVIKVPFPRLRNQLRIEHAIELLTQNAHLSLSIEGIAMQAGFKNKSTFYIAFKDVKCMTPMDWINKREI